MLSPFQSITLKKIIIAADCKASLEHQLRYKKDIPLDEAAQWKLRYCADLNAQLDERMKAMNLFLDLHGKLGDDDSLSQLCG